MVQVMVLFSLFALDPGEATPAEPPVPGPTQAAQGSLSAEDEAIIERILATSSERERESLIDDRILADEDRSEQWSAALRVVRGLGADARPELLRAMITVALTGSAAERAAAVERAERPRFELPAPGRVCFYRPWRFVASANVIEVFELGAPPDLTEGQARSEVRLLDDSVPQETLLDLGNARAACIVAPPGTHTFGAISRAPTGLVVLAAPIPTLVANRRLPIGSVTVEVASHETAFIRGRIGMGGPSGLPYLAEVSAEEGASACADMKPERGDRIYTESTGLPDVVSPR